VEKNYIFLTRVGRNGKELEGKGRNGIERKKDKIIDIIMQEGVVRNEMVGRNAKGWEAIASIFKKQGGMEQHGKK